MLTMLTKHPYAAYECLSRRGNKYLLALNNNTTGSATHLDDTAIASKRDAPVAVCTRLQPSPTEADLRL
jgi:hypothetical protein